MTARYLVGDVFDRLAELEDGSVDLVITSPPFLALRSYLPADHPDKGKEIGSEPTPAAFLDVMLKVMGELRRVTAAHGSVCIELGDTYAGSGGAGGDYNENGLRDGQPKFRQGTAFMSRGRGGDSGPVDDSDYVRPVKGTWGWPLAKSKTLIPELFRVALAYGINPLTGQPSPAGKWLVRNVVTWCRPNPPVGALGDKWRPATSDVVVAATSPKRYWDDLATRKAYKPQSGNALLVHSKMRTDPEFAGRASGVNDKPYTDGAGAPLLDYWEIPPTGYSGSHYAVYPPALVEPLMKAMCPPKVCRTCGQPSRRIVERERINGADDSTRLKNHAESNPSSGFSDPVPEIGWEYDRQTIGWSDCGHDDWRPGLILDPFAGSGTTLLVATGHGHDAIGIDLDERNAELALERVGPFLLEVVA